MQQPNRKPLWAFLGIILITQMSPASLAAEKAPLSKSTIRIVTSSTGFLYSPVYVAWAKGYFRQEGLDVTVFDGGGGPNAVAALVGGGADLGAVGLGNLSHAVEHGQKLVAVGDVVNDSPYVIVVRKDLAKDITRKSTLAQRAALLAHRTLATLAVGGSSGLFAKYVFTESKIDPESATLINMDNNPAQLASLKAGKIDGFVNSSPVTDQAIVEGYGFPLIKGSDIASIKGMAFIALAAQADFVRDHPDTVKAALRALRRAIELEAHHSKDAETAFYDFLSAQGSKQAVPENLRHAAWTSNESSFPKSLVITPAAVDRGRSILGIPATVSNEQLLSMGLAKTVMAEKL